MALLSEKGRLELDPPVRVLQRRLLGDGVRTVPVDDEIAIRAVELGAEGFHADPADRIITATAIIGGYCLATADSRISAWSEQSRMVVVLDPTV